MNRVFGSLFFQLFFLFFIFHADTTIAAENEPQEPIPAPAPAHSQETATEKVTETVTETKEPTPPAQVVKIKKSKKKKTKSKTNTNAATTAPEFNVAKLEATYKNAESFEADFIQEVYQASLARTKTSNGSIRLNKPNKVRWEIYKPEASLMVSNGNKLWYYTPAADPKSKAQIIEHSAKELNRQPIFKILTGKAGLEKEFKLEKATKTEILLSPLKPMGDLSQVQITIDPAKYLISEILILNTSGNRTKISLQNITLGAKLSPALFNFKPPEELELIQSNE